MTEEIWKPIKECINLYEISSLGRVSDVVTGKRKHNKGWKLYVD